MVHCGFVRADDPNDPILEYCQCAKGHQGVKETQVRPLAEATAQITRLLAMNPRPLDIDSLEGSCAGPGRCNARNPTCSGRVCDPIAGHRPCTLYCRSGQCCPPLALWPCTCRTLSWSDRARAGQVPRDKGSRTCAGWGQGYTFLCSKKTKALGGHFSGHPVRKAVGRHDRPAGTRLPLCRRAARARPATQGTGPTRRLAARRLGSLPGIAARLAVDS